VPAPHWARPLAGLTGSARGQRPLDLGGGLDGRALEQLAKVALVQELGAPDGSFRSQEGNDLEPRHLLHVLDEDALARIGHGHLELAAGLLEGNDDVILGVLVTDGLEGLEMHVADLEVDEAHPPCLGELLEEEGKGEAPALGHRALEWHLEPCGHEACALELGLVDEPELAHQKGLELLLGYEDVAHGLAHLPTRGSSATAAGTGAASSPSTCFTCLTRSSRDRLALIR
jgi:hypothetical protein